MYIFKSYFRLFIIYLIVIVTTKFIFLFYLIDNFLDLPFLSSIYSIFWGYKFDLAASGFLTFFAILFDFNKKIFAFISSLFLISIINLQIGDIFYFYESGRHISYEIFDIFTDSKSLFLTAYNTHFLLTITTIIVSLLVFIWSFISLQKITITKFDRYYVFKKFILLLISVFFIRGMFQGIPLNPWQSGQIANTKQSVLALNATYNIIYALINKGKKLKQIKLPKIDNKDIQKSFKELYPKTDALYNFPILTNKPNVVMLFLESWSAKFIKSYGYHQTTTPYLDSIILKSIRPKVMVAGGHRTTEGIFSTLSSLPNPLGKTIAKTQLQYFEYQSIIKNLNAIGYQSAFFQGTSKETSGTGSFVQDLGFNQSFGKKDIIKKIYKNNNWGVQDPDLYNFVLEKIQNSKQPFVVGINGATTHDLTLPDNFSIQNFVADEKLNLMLNTYKFADLALKDFMEKIKSKYPNTLFVILADHTGSRIIDNMENYLIPFAIYAPNILQEKYLDIILSQRDIAPSMFDLLVGDYKSLTKFSGKSIFRNEKYFADYFHNNVLGWVENNDVVEINIWSSKIECFVMDNLQKNKIKCETKHHKLKTHAIAWNKVYQDKLFTGTIYE